MIVEKHINRKLETAFSPIYLEVVNESYMHAVPDDSETHFKVVIVSQSFDGKRQVQRHQAVYAALNDEVSGPVHALAIHTYTPAEWEDQSTAPDSPNCMGGSKSG